jgi:hypothetical protein
MPCYLLPRGQVDAQVQQVCDPVSNFDKYVWSRSRNPSPALALRQAEARLYLTCR